MHCLLFLFLLFSPVFINADWRTEILEKHNEIRSKVASGQQTDANGNVPSAAYMRRMVWDKNLETKAQQVANLCDLDADFVRHLEEAEGANVAVNAEKNKYLDMVDGWNKEAENTKVDYGTVNQPINHFLRMIWSTSSKIGCGYGSDCPKGDTLVCYYKPQATAEESPLFKIGTPCSKCSECAEGLCNGGPPGVKEDPCTDADQVNCPNIKAACNDEAVQQQCKKTCGICT